MREITIEKVENLSENLKLKIEDNSHFQFIDGTAVVFKETWTNKIPSVTEESDSDEDDEFIKNWQIKPGTFWLHSEGLREKVYDKEKYCDTETSTNMSKIFNSFLENIDVSYEYKRLKRSYLLHGEPGTGKSALIRKFCRDIAGKEGICVIQADGEVNFGILTNMFNAPYDSNVKLIVLIVEDMGSKDYGRNLTTYNSSCLNFFDGHSGLFRVPTMIFATTNYARELGHQFTNRPGRFNKIIKVNLPTPDEVCNLVEDYTGEKLTESQRTVFRDSKNLTPDHCIEAILRSKIECISLEAAVSEIQEERQGIVKWEE